MRADRRRLAQGWRQPARPLGVRLAHAVPPSPYCRELISGTVSSSRKRSSRFTQDVSDAPQCVEQTLLTGVDLAAQIRHIGLDDVDVAAEVVPPHVVEDLRLRQHGARVDDEVPEQRELRRRQRNRLAGLPYFVGVLVEFDVGEGEPGVAGFLDATAGPAQDYPQPR